MISSKVYSITDIQINPPYLISSTIDIISSHCSIDMANSEKGVTETSGNSENKGVFQITWNEGETIPYVVKLVLIIGSVVYKARNVLYDVQLFYNAIPFAELRRCQYWIG